MRRLLTLGVAWLAAAVVATAVAWQGVALVTDQVTDDRPATLTAAEVDAALAGGNGGSGTSASTPGTGPTAITGPTSTVAGTVPEPSPIIRPYTVTGGSVAVSFAPSGVAVLWARPDPGYEVRSESADGNGWRVEFEGDDGHSRVEGWWDGGPRDRVEDDAADLDDDAVDDD